MNIIYCAMSIDGFIGQDTAKITDSVKFLDKFTGDYGYTEFYKTIDAVVMGFNTYDFVIKSGLEYPYKDIPNYIITNKKLDTSVSSNIIFTKFEKSLFTSSFASTSKNFWIVGGGKINSLFLQEDLIDIMIIFIMPLVLSSGIKLFSNKVEFQKDFKLVENLSYPEGGLKLVYQKVK